MSGKQSDDYLCLHKNIENDNFMVSIDGRSSNWPVLNVQCGVYQGFEFLLILNREKGRIFFVVKKKINFK